MNPHKIFDELSERQRFNRRHRIHFHSDNVPVNLENNVNNRNEGHEHNEEDMVLIQNENVILCPYNNEPEVNMLEQLEEGDENNVQNEFDHILDAIQGNNDPGDILLVGEQVQPDDLINDNDDDDGDDPIPNAHDNEQDFERIEINEDDDIDNELHDQNEIPDDYDDGNRPLYHDADITIRESNLLILRLMLNNNLNMSCISDIIEVIQLHCPRNNLIKNSLYLFKKFWNFNDNNVTIKKYYYCSKCQMELENRNSVCLNCPNTQSSYFIELPIDSHLTEMYKRDTFYQKLQQTFQRNAELYNNQQNDRRERIISDVYDGSIYRSCKAEGFLANRNHISFTFYTDGVRVYQSSKVSMWPLYLVINELPFEDRFKRENLLLLGLWHGDAHPNFNLFLYKFREILEEVFNGIVVTLPTGNRIRVRGIVLLATGDLPARSECLNFVQFNGFYGCPVCFIPGESIPTGPRGSTHTYPYIAKEDIELRTTNKCLDLANEVNDGRSRLGVKGHAALSRLMPNYIEAMAIDRMHGVDGGVSLKLLTLMFNNTYANCDFSLTNHLPIINDRLLGIRPPSLVHRLPRNVSDLIHWKTSELKTFFFYYSIPIFYGIMEEEHFKNYLRLVIGTLILSRDSITETEIDVAEDLLFRFVKEFIDLFGQQFASINVHLLLHLADCVRKLGPLWAYCCYRFEDLNGQFLRVIHGTWHLETQIASSQDRVINMTRFLEDLPDGRIKDFCLKKKKNVHLNEKISEHTYSVGSYKLSLRDNENITRALAASDIDENSLDIWMYLRLLKNNRLYISESYGRSTQMYSCAVQFEYMNHVSYGIVYCFIKTINNNCLHINCQCESSNYAIIREITCIEVFSAEGFEFTYDTSGFMYKIRETNNYIAVPVASLKTTCIYMSMEDSLFLAVPINDKELE